VPSSALLHGQCWQPAHGTVWRQRNLWQIDIFINADVLWAAAQVPVLMREVREPQGSAESGVASCGCAVGSSTGAGAGARGAGATGEEGRCVGWSHQVMRVTVGARWAVPGGQRLSWAAEARAADGTWVITAH
jgi:hypothetical protein